MPNFTILLPPAEGKQDGGNPFAPDMFDYRTSKYVQLLPPVESGAPQTH